MALYHVVGLLCSALNRVLKWEQGGARAVRVKRRTAQLMRLRINNLNHLNNLSNLSNLSNLIAGARLKG